MGHETELCYSGRRSQSRGRSRDVSGDLWPLTGGPPGTRWPCAVSGGTGFEKGSLHMGKSGDPRVRVHRIIWRSWTAHLVANRRMKTRRQSNQGEGALPANAEGKTECAHPTPPKSGFQSKSTASHPFQKAAGMLGSFGISGSRRFLGLRADWVRRTWTRRMQWKWSACTTIIVSSYTHIL